MNEICSWVDKELQSINRTELYLVFFLDAMLNEEEEDVCYLTNYQKGIELVLSKRLVVQSIHLFGKETDIQKRFKGTLPLDINFEYSRYEVQKLLGAPQRTGGGHRSLLLGYVNIWDKYIFPKYSIRFEYPEDENTIILLTVASLTMENVFNTHLQ